MERWLTYILLATLPFQCVIVVGDWDLPLARLLAGLIICLFVVKALYRQSWRLPPLIVTGTLLSFLGVAVASLLWAERPELALPRIALWLNFFPLIFVWYDGATRNPKELAKFIRVLVWGMGSAASVAMFIFFSQFVFGVSVVFHFLVDQGLPFFLGRELSAWVAQYPSLLVNIDGTTFLRATAFFPDPHVAAYCFGLAGFLALGWAKATGERIFLGLAGILFLADILTFSRGGYLGLLAGGIVYWVYQQARRGWPAPSRRWVWPIIGLSVLFVFGGPVLERLGTSFSATDRSSVERLALWREASVAIGERPLLGVGLGNYLSSARPLSPVGTPFYAHNLYLDMALEIGLVGLALLLGLLVMAMGRLLRVARSNPEAPALLAALTLYAVHSLFETAIFSLHVMLLLVLLLVLAFREPTQPLSTT